MAQSWWQVETQETVPAPGVRLQSQAVRVKPPFANFMFVWNRPLAVLTTTPDGEILRLPVQDVTRWVQIGLALGALTIIVLLRVITRSRNQEVSS